MGQSRVVQIGNLAAANAALFAASQTPVSGTPLTLTGSAADQARRVLLTFGNEASNRTMLITGKDRNGNTISETLAVPSGAGATVQSLQDFLSITSALPLGGGWSAAVTLGTNGVASSAWQQINREITPIQIGLVVVVVGTVNFTIEYTYDDFLNPLGNAPAIPTVFSLTALAAKAVTTDVGAAGAPAINGNVITGWRITNNSGGLAGATSTATAMQAGNMQAGS